LVLYLTMVTYLSHFARISFKYILFSSLHLSKYFNFQKYSTLDQAETILKEWHPN